MRKIINYLHLDQVGFLELLVALYPIMGQYSFGPLKLDMVMAFVVSLVCLLRGKRNAKLFKPVIWFWVYYVIHEILVFLFCTDMPQYMINATLSSTIITLSIPLIASSINYEKLEGSFNWVSFLLMAGMIYHFTQLFAGNFGNLHPLVLPGFSGQDDTSRLMEDIMRPTSFFWEPGGYATYMMIPIFMALNERKFIWVGICAFTVLLSTSTNGIAFLAVLLLVYALTSKTSVMVRFLSIVLLIVGGYFFSRGDYFEQGREKIENTDISVNYRVAAGPSMLLEMPLEHLIFGVPSPNLNDYIKSNPSLITKWYAREDGVYVSDFWHIWFKYGIWGLILLLLIYFKLFKANRYALPYVAVMFVALFTQSKVLHMGWLMEMSFILSFIYYQQNKHLMSHEPKN